MKNFFAKIVVVTASMLTPLHVIESATVTYTMQTGNFNSLSTEKNNNPPYAGTYNNGSTELAQYANGGSFNNTPGAAAFQTFTTTGNGQTGTTRALQVGDTFTITAFTSANPSAGGYLGISFRDSTTYSSVSSATDSATEARFQLDNTGGWKVYNAGTAVDSGQGSNSDRTFTIKITSANTFNATVGGTTYYDLSMAAGGGTVDSFAIYTVGDSNQNSFWKSASLSDTGTVQFGNGAGSGVSRTISGVVSDGLAANSTSSTVANAVTVSGDAGSQVNFTAANTYSGTTTVNANATLEVQDSSGLGSTAAGTTVNSGGTLKIWSASTLTTASESLTLNGAGVNSGGALRNAGGSNTYSGAVALGSASRINSDSGTLTLDVASGSAVSGSFGLTIGGAGNVTVNDNIGIGSSNLAKDGAGVLTLNAVNNYTGETQINQGTLAIGSSGGLSSSSVVYVGNGGNAFDATLLLTGTAGVANNIQFNTNNGSGGARFLTKTDGTAQTLSGNITNNIPGTTVNVTNSSGNLTISGVVAGIGGLTKTGSGTLTLSGNSANTMSGASAINAGTVILNKSANTAAVAGQVTVAANATLRTDSGNQLNNQYIVNNGTLDFNNNGQSLALGGAGTVTLGSATITNNNSGPDTFSGKISGSGGLVKTGAGNFTLSGTSDYSGSTSVNQGTLTISGGQSSSGYTLSGGNLTTSGSANLSDTAALEISSGSSTFTVGANDTIGSIAGSTGAINITNSGTLTLGANTTSTFSGVVSGNGSLVKGGTGTLTFDGSSANTYSGTTVVNAGVLVLNKTGVNALAGTPTINNGGVIRLGAGNQFSGDATFLTVNSGGEFDMNGFNETLAIQGAGTVSLGSGTMTINPSMSDAFSGVIAGTGAVIKTNTGTQILSGNSSYTGATTVGQGVLLAASVNALGGTGGATTVNSGAALQLSNASAMTVAENITLNGTGITSSGALRNMEGDNTVSGNITLGSNARINASTAGSLAISGNVGGGNNVLFVGGSRNTAISGAISGAGAAQDGTTTSLFKDSAGTLTLSGNNTYTGDTRVTAGRLTVASGGNLGSGSDVFISDGAVLAVNASTTAASVQETGTGNGGEVAIGSGATLTINGANKGSLYQDTISGAGNLVVNGSGDTSLSLYGTQTWSGTTTVSGGKLSTGVALGTGGLTVSGGTFEASAANILGAIGVTVSSGTYSLGGADTVGTFAISGGTLSTTNSSKLTAASYELTGGTVGANLGAGTLNANSGSATLNGTADATTVNVGGGSLGLGSAGRLASGAAVTVSNSGTLTLGGNETIASLAGTNSTLALGANTLTLGSGNFGGVISGVGGILTKTGSGTLTLSGVNTYSGGTLLNGGTLDADNSGAFGTGSVTVGSGTTLDLLSHSITNLIVNNGGTISASGTVSNVDAEAGTTTISGANSTVTQVSGTATVNVNAANASVASMSAGTLNVNASGAVVTNLTGGSIAVSNGVSLGLRGGSSSGVISGSGGVAKQSTGTLTLTGVNTYTGATTVEAGKLVVNGSISSDTTVQSGASLGGGGTVGSTTILSGATITPGNSPGSLNIAGDLTWSGGGSYDWEIYNVAGSPGSEWDLISVSGDLLFSSISSGNRFTINIYSLSALPNTIGVLDGFLSSNSYSWTILTAGDPISGFDANNFTLNLANFTNNNALNGGTFSLAASGNDLNLLFTAGAGPGPSPVPEPGTWAAAALLAGAAGYVRWRRRKEVEQPKA